MIEKKPHVFVSYARRDEAFAHDLLEDLRSRGVDARQFAEPLAGDSWRDGLADEIKAATNLVILVSNEAVASPWFNFEVGVALGRDKPFLPVFLNEGWHQAAPNALLTVQGIDASDLKPDEVAEQIAHLVEAA